MIDWPLIVGRNLFMTRLNLLRFVLLAVADFTFEAEAQTPALLGAIDSVKQVIQESPSEQQYLQYPGLVNLYSNAYPDSVAFYTQKGIDQARAMKDQLVEGRLLKGLSHHYYRTDNYAPAKNALSKAMALRMHNADSVFLSDDYLLYSAICGRMNDLNTALTYSIKAVDALEPLGPSPNLAQAYNNVGLNCMRLNSTNRAIEYYTRAIETGKSLQDAESTCLPLINLAVLLLDRRQQIGEAIELLEVALEFATKENLSKYEELALNNLGYTYFLNGEYLKAIEYADRAIALGQVNDLSSDLANSLHTKGMSYLKLEEYKQAEQLLLEAYRIALESNYRAALGSTLEGLAEFYETTENYQQAYAYQSKLLAFKSNNNQEELPSPIAENEVRDLFEEREASLISVAAQERNRLENIIKVVSSLLLVLGLLAIIIFLRVRIKRAESLQALTQQKLYALRSQMNPHFIFNSLNGIQNFVLKSERMVAYNYMTKFSNIMRLILDNSDRSFIPFRKEVELLQTYMELEKVRFREKLNFKIDYPENLTFENPEMPSMLLQPIVENAIIHGLSNAPNGGTVKISFQTVNEMLYCTVEDDGIGRAKAKAIGAKTHEKSITHINTHRRIEVLQKMGYPNASFMIKDLIGKAGEPLGTKVMVYLPFKRL